MSLLDSTTESTRYEAAKDLGAYGAEAKVAVPALCKRLDDESYRVRSAAADSIRKIGPVGILALVNALGNRSADIRAGAAEILADEFAFALIPFLSAADL